MTGKTGSASGAGSKKKTSRKQAPEPGPRKRAAHEAPKPEPLPEAAAADAQGARALIRAGIKALGDVRGDMVARQTRIFELLLGIGQSPAWRAAAKADPPPPDSFGKFEDVFDQRVARSLERLGMPTPAQLQALSERVEALTVALREVQSKPRRR